MASSTSHQGRQLNPKTDQVDRITKKIENVRDRISKASDQSHRQTKPRLVAISKLHPPTSILAAHQNAKQDHFGENYAQELEAKAKVLPETIKWHFVGKLQSNKAKLIANIPSLYLLETLDSIKCATALEKALTGQEAKREEPLRVYLQVNTSGEEAKGGLDPLTDDAASSSSELVSLAKHVIINCPNLQLQGVMTIGAASNSKASSDDLSSNSQSAEEVAVEACKLNPDFARLTQTRRNLVKALRNDSEIVQNCSELLQGNQDTGGLELSMGMSNDLEVAIRAGSDNVRVGTDCFGVRPPSRDEAMQGMKDELETR